MRVDSTQHTHRGACAGWGRSRECSHQSDAQRRLRAEIRSSVRARCRLPRVARVSLSLRCARAPFGQRVRGARIEGGCASRRTLRMPLFRYQGSSRAGGKESSPSKGCFHTPHRAYLHVASAQRAVEVTLNSHPCRPCGLYPPSWLLPTPVASFPTTTRHTIDIRSEGRLGRPPLARTKVALSLEP